MTNLKKYEQYHDYELVLEWFQTDGEGELPAKYQKWLKLWKFADQLVCQGHLDNETVAKMMVKEFPEEKLSIKSALRHVVQALNYYNSTQNLSKNTVRRMLARQIDNLIAILYEVLPSDPIQTAKQIGALYREKKEILQLHLPDKEGDDDQPEDTVIIFDTDHEKHGYPSVSEKQLDKLFTEWENAEIINEEERTKLEDELGISKENNKPLPEPGSGGSAKS
jgi:hypothetical protein